MAVLMGQTYVSTNFCGFSHNSIVFKPSPSWFGVPHQPRVDYAIETNDMVLPSLPILGNSHRCHGQDMVFSGVLVTTPSLEILVLAIMLPC